jgi:chitodextrinase
MKLFKSGNNSLLGRWGKFDRRILLLGLPLVVAVGYLATTTRAASGILYLTPSTAIVANGATFTVDIRENSGTDAVNAVQANLVYPTTQVDFVSIDSSTSAFSTEAEATGGAGVVKIARGTITAVTGDQLVSRVTFRSKMTSGQAAISFGPGSALVRASDNSDILVTKTGGTYGPDTTPPTAPTNLTSSSITGTTATVSWTASTDNVGVTGYKVFRDGVQVSTQTGLSFADSGLAMSTTYSYTASAVDAVGNESAKSVALSVTTKDTLAPTVPSITNITAPSSSQVALTWSASTDTGGSGLKGYKVYRSTGGASANLIASPTTTSYTDNTVVGSTAYAYTVSSTDNAGNESAKSAAASITTPAPPDTTAPTAPTSLRTTTTALTSISLAWNASTDNVGVTGYRVMNGATLVTTVNALAYTVSNLSPGTAYSFTVTAIDASGNVSAASTALAISTLVQKKGDINLDNAVDIYDLSIFLSKWNTTDAASDLNKDGSVNIFDLSILLGNWLK